MFYRVSGYWRATVATDIGDENNAVFVKSSRSGRFDRVIDAGTAQQAMNGAWAMLWTWLEESEGVSYVDILDWDSPSGPGVVQASTDEVMRAIGVPRLL